ncbi:hypothetical protein SESBI_43252 [Sesbania bispinosa]|nr:hypothetical protein SESBI_43252 [Sesbania bispinosa]
MCIFIMVAISLRRIQGERDIGGVRWKFGDGLYMMKSDADLLEAIEVAKRNNGELHVYYDHEVFEPEVVDMDFLLESIYEPFILKPVKEIGVSTVHRHAAEGEGKQKVGAADIGVVVAEIVYVGLM